MHESLASSSCSYVLARCTFTSTLNEVKFRYSQVLLSSSLRHAGSNGLMCCNFCAKITWILGTKEAGGLCTLCSSAVSMHSIGSRVELSLGKGTAQLNFKTFHVNFSTWPRAAETMPQTQRVCVSNICSQCLATAPVLKPQELSSLWFL